MKPARKLLRKLIKEELSEYMIKGFDAKDFVDEALKKSGIKVTKYLPMKSGWLGSRLAGKAAEKTYRWISFVFLTFAGLIGLFG